MTPSLSNITNNFSTRRFVPHRRSSPQNGGVNSLLFYLINTLHLCLQRIEDADKILCGDVAARNRSRSWALDVEKRHVSGYFRDRDSPDLALIHHGTDGAQRLARRQMITNTVFRWMKRVGVSLGVGGEDTYTNNNTPSPISIKLTIPLRSLPPRHHVACHGP